MSYKKSVHTKLDEILKSIQIINAQINNLKESVQDVNKHLETLDKKLTKRSDELEMKINQKVDMALFHQLEEKVQELLKEQNLTKLRSKREQISKEAYSKRLNLLVQGLVEDESVAWEKREETEAILNKFLTEALQLNPGQVKLTDLHRLPQHPIYKDKVKINRPIIFKVASVFDKHTIMTRLKMLKDYNQRQQESCPTAPKVYVSEHLPKEMYEQKKLLMPHFKDARKMKLNTTWMVQNGKYCLIVDDKKVHI